MCWSELFTIQENLSSHIWNCITSITSSEFKRIRQSELTLRAKFQSSNLSVSSSAVHRRANWHRFLTMYSRHWTAFHNLDPQNFQPSTSHHYTRRKAECSRGKNRGNHSLLVGQTFAHWCTYCICNALIWFASFIVHTCRCSTKNVCKRWCFVLLSP